MTGGVSTHMDGGMFRIQGRRHLAPESEVAVPNLFWLAPRAKISIQ
jgi:hypothetical protein